MLYSMAAIEQSTNREGQRAEAGEGEEQRRANRQRQRGRSVLFSLSGDRVQEGRRFYPPPSSDLFEGLDRGFPEGFGARPILPTNKLTLEDGFLSTHVSRPNIIINCRAPLPAALSAIKGLYSLNSTPQASPHKLNF